MSDELKLRYIPPLRWTPQEMEDLMNSMASEREHYTIKQMTREQLVLVTQYFGNPFTGPMFAYQECIWKAMQLVSDQIDADGLKLIQLAR